MHIENDKAYELAQCMSKLFCLMKPKKFINDIKPSQMMVMVSIAHINIAKGYATPSMISDELGLSKSALTAILNTLEEKKLIQQSLSNEDRRMLLLSITSEAEKLLDVYHDNIQSSLLNLTTYLGEEDTEKLIYLIKKANNFFTKD